VKIAGSILFLLLLIFQSTGYYMYMKIQQQHIRYEIKQQIKAGVPEGELVLLKICRSTQENRDEFQYIHSHEFRYLGKMYDIIRQESHGETTLFYCICDEKETLLFARLDEQVKNEMKNLPGSGKQRERLLQWHSTLFFAEDNITGIITPSFNDRSTPYSFHLKDWKQPPETPPPLI
jgi:hypothetical protein